MAQTKPDNRTFIPPRQTARGVEDLVQSRHRMRRDTGSRRHVSLSTLLCMNKLSHIAINADDVPASRAFYRETFDWQFSAWVTARLLPRRGGRTPRARRDRCAPAAPPIARRPTDHRLRMHCRRERPPTRRAALATGGRLLMQTTIIARVGHLIWLADPRFRS